MIDPELMLAKPRGLTISTGLDALSHALESLWNINVTPDSAECAVSAAAEILDVLPKLAENLNSLELRSRMAAAALMSGIACSFTLPIVLQCVADEGGLRGTSLRRIFGTDLAAGAQTLSDFLHTLGVSTHPKDHGPNQREWRSLVDAAFSGERGQNFVGTRKNFHLAACALGIV